MSGSSAIADETLSTESGAAELVLDRAAGRKRWAGIDGLRGTAILGVLVCHYSSLLPQHHAWVGVLVQGWAGVDLFFVISGFLITGILFDAKGTPGYFRNFYARRTLRIFPLYYGFLALMLIVLLFVRDAADVEGLWRAQPSLWTYTSNFWIAAQTKWSLWAEIVIPLWSLAVEEQFYLLWPIVIFMFSHRALVRICVGVMIGALLLRIVLTASGTHWFALYVWTPTRADSLAAGALVALLMRLPDGERLARRLAKYGAPIGLLAVLIISGGFDPTRHPWLRVFLYTALAVLFASLLFWSIDATSLAGVPKRFYELRALRTIGRYSYGIYIFHLPLMYLTMTAFARYGWRDPNKPGWISAIALIGVNVALTAAISLVSFHAYEKQFLKLKRYFPQPSR
jgi:peptidoglycan/LPS O-acetylase OafA/YrhL